MISFIQNNNVVDMVKIGITKGAIWGMILGAIVGFPAFIIGAIPGIGLGGIVGAISGITSSIIFALMVNMFFDSSSKRKSKIQDFKKLFAVLLITAIGSTMMTLIIAEFVFSEFHTSSIILLIVFNLVLLTGLIPYLYSQNRIFSHPNRHLDSFIEQ